MVISLWNASGKHVAWKLYEAGKELKTGENLLFLTYIYSQHKIKGPMKTKSLLLFILMFIPVLSYAGEIYGTIKGDDGKPLINQVVQIRQNDKVIASDTTDANGFFTVSIKEVGKFKLEVIGYKDASFEVFSSNKSTRYNLLMNKAGEKWMLKNL